jgi:hypothetical protein
MTAPSANDWLMGGGVASAKFPTPGTTVGGEIVRPPTLMQQRDISTGKPKTWENGDPMMQLAVQVSTGQIDPAVPNDDGVRAIYVKGQMQQAVREAIRQAGAPGLEVGGRLAVTYVRDGEPPQRGMNAPKEYTAQYVSAANVALTSDQPAPAAAPLTNGNGTQFPGQTPFQQPAAAPAPQVQQPVAAGPSPEALAALAQLTPEQRAAIGL